MRASEPFCLSVELVPQNIVTSFSDISHLNSRWENKIDGLIGYEILSRQKTLVSVHSKKVVFIQ